MSKQCHVIFILLIPSFHTFMHSLGTSDFNEWQLFWGKMILTEWVMFCVAYLGFGDIRDDTTEFCWEGRLVCRPWHYLQCSEYRLGTCTHTYQYIDPTLKESQPIQGNSRGVWIMHRNDICVGVCTPFPRYECREGRSEALTSVLICLRQCNIQTHALTQSPPTQLWTLWSPW